MTEKPKETSPDNPHVNEPKIKKDERRDSIRKFSKLKLLQSLGLLSKKLNYETSELESSWLLSLVSWLSLLSKLLFAWKLVISSFFPREHIVQLYLGR